MDPEGSTLIMRGSPGLPSAERGRRLAGRYLIGEMIGRGGMSTVHRAGDEVLHRDVAVKILLPALAEGDPEHVARFEREARAAAALHHPAVVKVYDTGRDRGTHFIVMEYVAGQSLDRILAAGPPLEPEVATRIASEVAAGLAAAHSAGILHRDVKPANVMLTPEGEAKVLDFGIARARQDPTLTQPTFAIGTAAYMSPERVLGRPGRRALGHLLPWLSAVRDARGQAPVRGREHAVRPPPAGPRGAGAAHETRREDRSSAGGAGHADAGQGAGLTAPDRGRDCWPAGRPAPSTSHGYLPDPPPAQAATGCPGAGRPARARDRPGGFQPRPALRGRPPVSQAHAGAPRDRPRIAHRHSRHAARPHATRGSQDSAEQADPARSWRRPPWSRTRGPAGS